MIEPVADIHSGQLGRDAGEKAPWTARPREVEAKGADQMPIHCLDHLAPAGVLALGYGGLWPLGVGGREEGGPIDVVPVVVPPRPTEALIGEIRSRATGAGPEWRPARPGRAHIGSPVGTVRGG